MRCPKSYLTNFHISTYLPPHFPSLLKYHLKQHLYNSKKLCCLKIHLSSRELQKYYFLTFNNRFKDVNKNGHDIIFFLKHKKSNNEYNLHSLTSNQDVVCLQFYSLQMLYFKIVEMLKVRSFSKIIKQYNVSNVYIFVASDASERGVQD